MARTKDDVAHAQRRQCFLEAAGRLTERKGYEQMTVQDVLDEVRQSKGAFYHYFDSKQALVEGLVDDQGRAMCRRLELRVGAPGLSAVEKLVRLFRESNQMKLERQGLWSALLPMWLSDGNAAVRERASAQVRERMVPVLAQIITEGVGEGVFTTTYPDQVGRMVFAMLEDFKHSLMGVMTLSEPGERGRARVEQAIAAFHETLERVLGAPPASLHLLDAGEVMAWVDRSERGAVAASAPASAPPARPELRV